MVESSRSCIYRENPPKHDRPVLDPTSPRVATIGTGPNLPIRTNLIKSGIANMPGKRGDTNIEFTPAGWEPHRPQPGRREMTFSDTTLDPPVVFLAFI